MPALAERLRIATWHAPLSRDGPGVLIRDIQRGKADAAIRQIAELRADILLLTSIDFDLDLFALTALRDAVAESGWRYDHLFALPPNTGVPTGLDLDRNGRFGEGRDAQGFGRFQGQAGMALLSRHPIATADVRDLSGLLWRDVPGSRMPMDYFGPEAQDILRLSHSGHWIVPVTVNDDTLTLLAFAAGPPVFDGPEDRNGLRNADEIALWQHVLDGAVGTAPRPPFTIIGNANLDPFDGDGRREVIATLLADPRLQDPAPEGPGGLAAANPEHRGPPARDNADFRDPVPGNLRTSYVLPSADLRVTGSGVAWPEDAPPSERSRHFPVWVDIEW
ncbi:endonuclease/exonuclease/phosphatase family protein [Pseudaestuariivita atlantica]|uniref:endonuclease/exonuclease/phosphatase family protein n=1 Tax=Pseudaestuariivita atlantica TaxID=1317121 RepID=UPI000ADDFCE0|nr:endonuclease/exonuclease/phosphatase family protein [Pseudaestuariivita atlantica]